MLQQFTRSESVELVTIAEVAEPKTTCATCPLFKPFNDGTGRGLCCGVADTSLVVRDHHGQTQDCLNLIDEQATAQQELNKYVEAQALSIAPEIEVDSALDPEFGELYRVWYSYHLLGTFYSSSDGKWIAQPCDSDDRPRCSTATEAELIIVAISGLLVAGISVDVIDLLNKPLDQLTLAAQQEELVAA